MNTDGFLSVMSWNINGGILDKLPVLEKLCESFSVICIQEHFLTDLNSQLLCPSSNVTVHLSPARRFKAKGRPSGGLAVLTTCQSELLEMCDCYLAVTVDNLVIVNLYLPTNYRDEASERKFAIACRKVAKLLKKIEKMNRKCILIGDFNCDLLENSSARAETFLSILPTGYSIVPKDRNYSFISTSGNTSNLDHVVFLHPPNPDLIVKVGLEGEYSDHIPLFLSIPVRDTPSSEFAKRKSKFLRVKSWDKIDLPRVSSKGSVTSC